MYGLQIIFLLFYIQNIKKIKMSACKGKNRGQIVSSQGPGTALKIRGLPPQIPIS
jgi:hypothetical protein